MQDISIAKYIKSWDMWQDIRYTVDMTLFVNEICSIINQNSNPVHPLMWKLLL